MFKRLPVNVGCYASFNMNFKKQPVRVNTPGVQQLDVGVFAAGLMYREGRMCVASHQARYLLLLLPNVLGFESLYAVARLLINPFLSAAA